MLQPTQLGVLATVAEDFGAGTLELTARGNLQVRGITEPAAVAEAVNIAGLLPSPTHERVRNIVASPLSGRVGGHADVRPWVAELDVAIQTDPELAELPGRFWFSLDDGSADVSGLAADAGVHVLPDGVALLLAGRDTGVRLDPADTVTALISIARRFLRLRGKAWRVAELADRRSLLGDLAPTTPPGGGFPPARPPIGWITQTLGAGDRVALGAAVPLGVLTARQAHFVAAIDAPVVVTPRRSLLICDLDEGVADASLRVLAPLGLVFDGNSPWLQISACVGSPGCARSAADVRAEASKAAESGAPTGPVHYVGCERACGRPATGTVLLATAAGYAPLGTPSPRTPPSPRTVG
jgi:precorrin-3B synthase